MVTSWPKRLPGPGMSAERVAERIAALSGGRLQITVAAAGEVVPAFEVLDAVGGGVAEMGHTASFFWQGKEPAAAFYTTVPFGLTPNEHVAWVEAGGGQALWDELYAPFGVKPFMAGNTGVCMGGWFRREIKSRDDMRGAEDPLARPGRRSLSPARRDAADHAARRNPASRCNRACSMPPNSSAPAPTSRSGSIAWRRCITRPGFNKPNGTGECIVSLKAWNALDAEMKAIVAHACAAEAAFALSEMERLNAEALNALVTQHNVKLMTFPADLVQAARKESADVLAQLAVARRQRAKVHNSYRRVSRQGRALVEDLAARGAGGEGVG